LPTILTNSQKLSTGGDTRNILNIVLLRQVNSMIEFKQIVGHVTRLFNGKEFFAIYDFTEVYKHFSNPEWDDESLQEDKDGDSGVTLLSGEVKEPVETCVMNGVIIITANVSAT